MFRVVRRNSARPCKGASGSCELFSQNDDIRWNFTEICNQDLQCSNRIKYSPVCSIQENHVYYSPCHAGCSSVSSINETKVSSHFYWPDGVNILVSLPIFLVTTVQGVTRSYWAYKAIQAPDASNREKKTVYSVVHYLSEKTRDERCISNRSCDTAAFIIHVMLTPTEQEFLQVVGEQKRYSACGPVASRWLWRWKNNSVHRKWKPQSNL